MFVECITRITSSLLLGCLRAMKLLRKCPKRYPHQAPYIDDQIANWSRLHRFGQDTLLLQADYQFFLLNPKCTVVEAVEYFGGEQLLKEYYPVQFRYTTD
jgi:hypothetical protein